MCPPIGGGWGGSPAAELRRRCGGAAAGLRRSCGGAAAALETGEPGSGTGSGSMGGDDLRPRKSQRGCTWRLTWPQERAGAHRRHLGGFYGSQQAHRQGLDNRGSTGGGRATPRRWPNQAQSRAAERPVCDRSSGAHGQRPDPDLTETTHSRRVRWRGGGGGLGGRAGRVIACNRRPEEDDRREPAATP